MKKNFLFVVMSLTLLLLVACSAGDNTSTGKGEEGVLKFRIAGQYPPDHPESIALEKFKETVEEKTDGAIEISVYPANQLGDYTQIYEEVMQGTIEMALIDVPSQYDSKLELSYLHYLATNYEEAKEMFAPESLVWEALDEVHNELGVKFLGFSAGGFGGVTSMDELVSPKDLTVGKGGQFRVPTMSPFRVSAEDMGFNPVSIPFAELYTSLQTGVVDGSIGTNAVDTFVGYSDIAKYYYAYNNFFQATSLIMNEELWSELSDVQKKAIDEAATELATESFETAESNEREYLKKMEEHQIKVIEFTDEDLQQFRQHARDVSWPKLKESLGEETIEALLRD